MSEQLTLDHGENLALLLLRAGGWYVGSLHQPARRPTGSSVKGLETDEVGFVAYREVDGRTFRAASLVALAQKAIGAPVVLPIRTEADFSGGSELDAEVERWAA